MLYFFIYVPNCSAIAQAVLELQTFEFSVIHTYTDILKKNVIFRRFKLKHSKYIDIENQKKIFFFENKAFSMTKQKERKREKEKGSDERRENILNVHSVDYRRAWQLVARFMHTRRLLNYCLNGSIMAVVCNR